MAVLITELVVRVLLNDSCHVMRSCVRVMR